jgi:hypothetical protein
MKKRNLFKLAALTAVFALASMFANAQTLTSSSTNTVDTAAAGPAIKVIDNKGTVKYIQSNNGITTITSTVSGNLTRTTFQLGGSLSDSTYIDLAGNKFGLKNLTYSSTGKTYEFVVIDSITGEFRKQKLTDLIDAGSFIEVVTADVIHTTTATHPITTGVSLESFKTVYVFRNGAKLLAGVDYTIDNTTPTNSIVVLYLNAASNAYGSAASFEAYNLYKDDRIEIQFIK